MSLYITYIADAADGHKTSLDGTEKFPIAPDNYTTPADVKNYIAGEGTMATVAYVNGIATNLGKRQRVRVMDTTDSDPATSGYTNGTTIDGITVATGDYVVRNSSSHTARNGIWAIVASGAASRVPEFDTYNEHPASLISIAEGSSYADTLWLCSSDAGGTLNTTAILFMQVKIVVPATDTVSGIVELATVAEAGIGTDTTRAVTPAGLFPATADVASATTTDLGAVASKNVRITGTTTITSFGTAPAGISREGYFSGALILTHNSTLLILPGAGNITTAAGDAFEAISLGSGNWKVRSYTKANGQAVVASSGGGDMLAANNLSEVNPATAKVNLQIEAAQVDVASASTCNIGAAASENVRITGTTTITAFDTVASGVWRIGYFSGALILTHNATSLVLPGAANITTAAGDSFIARSLGSGNWKILFYEKADGTALAGSGGGSGGTTFYDRRWVRGNTAHAKDDEFNDASIDAAWNRVDTSGHTGYVDWAEGGDSLSLTIGLTADAAYELHAQMKSYSMSIGDYITTHVTGFGEQSAYPEAGLLIADGITVGSGKQAFFQSFFAASINHGIAGDEWNNYNSRPAGLSWTDSQFFGQNYHCKLEYSAANTFKFYASPDGIHWRLFYTRTITMTPAYIGLAGSSFTSNTPFIFSFDYFRVNAP